MKKVLSIFLSVLMLTSVVAAVDLSAYAAVSSGDYTYTVLDDGTAEITKYSGSEQNVEIPTEIGRYTVTSIGTMAFDFNSTVVSVSIPETVTNIGDFAFSDCTSLTEIVIPNGVTKLDTWTFLRCESLVSVKIPYSITKINYGAFEDCVNLENVYYHGTKDEWKAISIGNGNGCLTSATINFEPHSYKTIITKATKDGKGKIVKECTVCGKKVTTIIYRIKGMSLSTSEYSYNGKAKKPAVTVKDSQGNKISSKYYDVSYLSRSGKETKKVSSMKKPGKYYVKVTFKDRYSGSMKVAVTIKPKKTSIKSIKASSKGFTVKWGKVSTQNTGYQVQYSTSKSFKNAKTATIKKTGTTSKKVTKLKAKKKYYVRVRTYKTVKVNGKSTKIYSGWSSVKGVTTKK